MEDVPITPMGRGALLKQLLLKQKQDTTVRAPGGEDVATETVPPRPRGRAALLERLKRNTTLASSFSSERTSDTVSSVDRSISQTSFETKTSTPMHFKGEEGTRLNTTCNYIQLTTDSDPGRGVFEYELRFEPVIDSKPIKIKLLNQIVSKIGRVRSFDGGHCLYLPFKTKSTRTEYNVLHPVDQSVVKLILIYKKQKPYADCVHLFNVLFKRIMHQLLFSRIGRNFFDEKRNTLIPQHKLEIIPGYVIVIDEYEGGLFLCLDTLHKVLRTESVHEHLRNLYMSVQGDFRKYKQVVNEILIGQSILTRYNNKLYRVDDIIWDKTPLTTFETVSGPVSFVEYFKKQYDLNITDLKQPLLLHNTSMRVSGSADKVDRQLCLIPELCTMTGLTDSQRNNIVLMRDMAVYTRVTPAQRLSALRKFVENVQSCVEAKQILSDWGLTLKNATIDLLTRVIDRETIRFGDGVMCNSSKADWTAQCGNNKVLFAVDLHDWAIICTVSAENQAKEYTEMCKRIAAPMGIRMNNPKIYVIPNDQTNTWIEKTRNVISENHDKLQIIVFICPTMRNDRYSAIKKLCCSVAPIPSQVINLRTLNNKTKLRGIVQKIALQINCKLGGALWSVRFPFKNWMICGVDVFHTTNKESVCAFVSSLNDTMSRWYTSTVFQQGEIGDYMKKMFVTALEKQREANGQYPTNIIIYRDGVGDGQIKHCQQYEVAQYVDALQCMKLDQQIKLSVILVQKRINTRIMTLQPEDNPPPGTVLDHTVTRRNYEDFFLVSQNVRQGTVSPTHYIIIHDSIYLTPDRMQRLTYKMCHLYYNWTGTIRVPAPCQYAHKVAYLTGKHINKLPDQKLANRLYYL